MVLQLFPSHEELAPDKLYADLTFPPGPGRPYVVLNMVSSADGKIVLQGRAKGLGSPLDQACMLRLRAAADVVITGAATVRAEEGGLGVSSSLAKRREQRGLPPQPVVATVSASLNLSPDLPFFRRVEQKPVIFTVSAAPHERRETLAAHARLIELGTEAVDVHKMLLFCQEEFGARVVLVEGGPLLNQQLFERDLVDDLFWTVAPKIYGGGASRTLVEGPPPERIPLASLELVSSFLEGDELFLRYRVRRSD